MASTLNPIPVNQSIEDFTVVGGQLAHLTNCGLSSENKTDKIWQTNEASSESRQEVVTVQSKLIATNCKKQELDSACWCHCCNECIVSTRKPKLISVLKFTQVKEKHCWNSAVHANMAHVWSEVHQSTINQLMVPCLPSPSCKCASCRQSSPSTLSLWRGVPSVPTIFWPLWHRLHPRSEIVPHMISDQMNIHWRAMYQLFRNVWIF